MSLSPRSGFLNPYIRELSEDHKGWAFSFSEAQHLRGKWRQVFSKNYKGPLHLEIGPGNGRHFARLCLDKPGESFLAVEFKYKASAQTIKRVRKSHSLNGRLIHCDASLIGNLFKDQELNNIYIHFPDPWLKKRRQKKHRLLQENFCQEIYKLQKPGSFLELKTDSEEYLNSSVQWLKKAGYRLSRYSLDLYKGRSDEKSFMEDLSWFELLFFQKKAPVRYALFVRN